MEYGEYLKQKLEKNKNKKNEPGNILTKKLCTVWGHMLDICGKDQLSGNSFNPWNYYFCFSHFPKVHASFVSLFSIIM